MAENVDTSGSKQPSSTGGVHTGAIRSTNRPGGASRAPLPPAPPGTLVIFGAHGDLTKRLLTPSLYNLVGAGLLSPQFKVIGVDRIASDDDAWRRELRATMDEFTKDKSAEFYTPEINEDWWNDLAGRMSYVQADFTNVDQLRALGDRIGDGNAVFYLAVAARFFAVVVENLGKAGLTKAPDGAYRRIVVEKPFGSDLDSSKKLNAQLLSVLDEDQIYRIDHFLGKETVQNILANRFANSIVEPLWNRNNIDHIQITAAETVGVEKRGAFYEPTGALRDMVPNHLFQLLAMVAMEPPSSFSAEAVRSAKEALFESIRPCSIEDAVRGQYTAGTVKGRDVVGYRQSEGVAPDSATETYVALRLHIDNWRWSGVPFYLRTGKSTSDRLTEVVVQFKRAPISIFRDEPVDDLAPNRLTLNIQPEQGMTMTLNAKIPGASMDLAPVEMKFRYEDAFNLTPNVGYETLLYDCLTGDATLFQRADNIDAAWTIVDQVLKAWAADKAGPELYEAGSAGPSGADRLLADDGRAWAPLENKAPDKIG